MALLSKTGRGALIAALVLLAPLLSACGNDGESAITTEPARSAAPTTGGEVEVYFNTGDGTDCSEVSAFVRAGDTSVDPAQAAFQELVGGPTTAEEASGASSPFSPDTADAVLSTCLKAGVLTIDLADITAEVPEAGTSCGSTAFISSLNATAFQFPAVDRVRYLLAGSCSNFGELTQTGVCEFDRTD